MPWLWAHLLGVNLKEPMRETTARLQNLKGGGYYCMGCFLLPASYQNVMEWMESVPSANAAGMEVVYDGTPSATAAGSASEAPTTQAPMTPTDDAPADDLGRSSSKHACVCVWSAVRTALYSDC